MTCPDPAAEINICSQVLGYGNDSHGDTCCMCGNLLPAVEFDGLSTRYPGVGQLEIIVHRDCTHQDRRGRIRWGGYACSEGCAINLREWTLSASATPREICPDQHDAKGLAGTGPPGRPPIEVMYR